jgi:tetratricopeptide (TPR) repeat protein
VHPGKLASACSSCWSGRGRVRNAPCCSPSNDFRKSQIAIEWSYRIQDRQPQTWVFWIHGATGHRFETGYKNIAAQLQLPGWDDPKTDFLNLVSRWLSNADSGRWCLILDNADDIDVFKSQSTATTQNALPLSSYIPQAAHGSVLITTKDRSAVAWLGARYENVITISVMTPEDAEQLLSANIPKEPGLGNERAELVRELGYLPLAIIQAAAFINTGAPRMTVSQYLKYYKSDEASPGKLLEDDFGDPRRDAELTNSIVKTLHMTLLQINKRFPSAIKLLKLMAMFDRQGVPDVLMKSENVEDIDFEIHLKPLFDFSLITTEKTSTSFEMHRLVHIATQWFPTPEETSVWQEAALRAADRVLTYLTLEYWQEYESLKPHVEEVLKVCFLESKLQLIRADLACRSALINSSIGRLDLAKLHIEESLGIRADILGDNDNKTIDSIQAKALILKKLGRLDEAAIYYRRALEAYGSNETDKAKEGAAHAKTNLARTLMEQRLYAEAEAKCVETIRECQLNFGLEHPTTLHAAIALCEVYVMWYKYESAEPLVRDLISVSGKALGMHHVITLKAFQALARIETYKENYEEAERLVRNLLVLQKEMLGSDHWDVLYSSCMLANILQTQAKYGEAQSIYRNVLQKQELIPGPHEPATLTTLGSLAATLLSAGEVVEAEKLYREVLSRYERAQVRNHRNKLVSMKCLFLTVFRQRRFEEAEILCRSTLTEGEAVLGPEDIDILQIVHSLTLLLTATRKYKEALGLCDRAYNGFQKLLGVDHQETLRCRSQREYLINKMNENEIAEQETNRKDILDEDRERDAPRGTPAEITSDESDVILLQEKHIEGK